jgi:glycosyltransferase involved in cell wall biosynthesis
MRIGFDARPLLGPRTGVGVWLEGLLGALAAATNWEFVGFLPRRADLSLGVVPRPRLVVSHSPLGLPGTLWLHTWAACQVGTTVDVYLGTLAILPRRLKVPTVAVLHDLTPRTRSHRHTLANRFCFNAYLEQSLLEAAAVVCVSHATRARLAEILPGQARGAVVIGHGVDPLFFAPPALTRDETRTRFAGGAPFIVQLGTLEPRKGVVTLLQAHGSRLQQDAGGPALVLAGGRGWGGRWLEEALARHPAPGRVHLPGYVTRDEAKALLTHAEMVVVASEEEGFGLPLAEALACGAACVASDAPALVEVAGGAARHFPRGNAQALAAAMEEVAIPARRAELQARARERARQWRWDAVVPAWRSLLAEVVTASPSQRGEEFAKGGRGEGKASAPPGGWLCR